MVELDIEQVHPRMARAGHHARQAAGGKPLLNLARCVEQDPRGRVRLAGKLLHAFGRESVIEIGVAGKLQTETRSPRILPQGVLLHLGGVIIHFRAPWAEVADHRGGGARPAPTADGSADGRSQPAPVTLQATMNLESIQAEIQKSGLDGWLFCDHHERDRLTACTSNLRQLGLAMTMCVDDAESRFPKAGFSDNLIGLPPAARCAEVRWQDQVAVRLLKLQKADGSWVNPEPRWWEADPVLAPCYAVMTLEMLDGRMP